MRFVLAAVVTFVAALFWLDVIGLQIARAEDVSAQVTHAATRHGIPPRLAHAIVRVESGYRCQARNGNARGIGQVFPRTAASVGVYGNLFDCATGLEASMRYLRAALMAGGSGCAGVSLYNLGIYARPRCTAYGRRVMALAARG